MSNLETFVRSLPKAELHVHLEGTLEPEMQFELAARNGVRLPYASPEEVRAAYTFTDLTSFLSVYYPAMQVLRTAQDFHDLAYAYLSKAAADGVRHAEMFFDPQAHTTRGVPLSEVVSGYRQAIVEARSLLGIDGDLIMCFLRDLSVEHAMTTLAEALTHKDWILGVGLDSDESGNPPEKFAEVYAKARAEGFLLTLHCDIDQVDTVAHIKTAIEGMGVQRVDHGSNIVADRSLMQVAKDRRIGFTSCPMSNSFVTEDMKAAEIVDMLRYGLLVTINSDDPAYFGGYISANYEALARRASLGEEDLVQLARNSFEASWLADSRRQQYLDEIDSYVNANSRQA